MRYGVLASVLAAVACAAPGGSLDFTQTSSIVRSEAGIWLTSNDDCTVLLLDPDSLEVRRRIAVQGGPNYLALAGDTAVVTLARATEVAIVRDLSGEPSVRYVPVPCGGTAGVIATRDDTEAWITCPDDDRLLRLDLRAAAVIDVHEVEGRPLAIARAGDDLWVTASRLGRVLQLDSDGAVLASQDLEATPGFAARQLQGLTFSDGLPLVVYQRLDHDSDRDRPPEQGGYGSVIDGTPRIEPRLWGACGSRYASFDGGDRVFSGPSAIASRGGLLWITHAYTDNVALLTCVGGAPRVRASFRVGRAPRGIALSEDGRTAWVDVGFDHAIARLEADGAAAVDSGGASEDDPSATTGGEASAERQWELQSTWLSEAARRGRSLFSDATNTHLTPSGVVTCATCHPDTGEDGLRWFFHTPNVGPKLRRTPAAWAAKGDLAPFHWDGEFDDASILTRTTIVEIMEGDGLLVDTSAVAAWMEEAPPPPGQPAADEADREAGAAVFEDAGCAGCHGEPSFSDDLAHAVVPPSADGLAAMTEVFTPSLLGVRARPPYLHDGRAPTLRSVLVEHNPGDVHGSTSQLSGEQLDSLLVYLRSL